MDVDARESDEDFDFSRVVALTDGVFAIAATLLVLGLSAPTTDVDLTQRLLDQSDNLFAYALSFAVIGRLWVTHHNFFKVLRRFDSLSIALNLVYLAWIALIPFASQFLGNVGHSAQAVIVYAACLVGVGLTFGAEVSLAYRRDLIASEERAEVRTQTGPGTFAVAICFLISMPVALISPWAAIAIWLVSIVVPRRFGDLVASFAMGD